MQLGSIWLVQAKTGDIDDVEFTVETAHIDVFDLRLGHFDSMGKILPVGLHFLTYLMPRSEGLVNLPEFPTLKFLPVGFH